jgi:hypothetical protein
MSTVGPQSPPPPQGVARAITPQAGTAPFIETPAALLSVPAAPVTWSPISNLALPPQELAPTIAATFADQLPAERRTDAAVSARLDFELSLVPGRPAYAWDEVLLNRLSNPHATGLRSVSASASASGTPPPFSETKRGGSGVVSGAGGGTGTSGPAVALFALLSLTAPRLILRVVSSRDWGIRSPAYPLLDRPG